MLFGKTINRASRILVPQRKLCVQNNRMVGDSIDALQISLHSSYEFSKFDNENILHLVTNVLATCVDIWYYNPSNIFAHARLVSMRHVGEYPRIFPNF